MIEQESQYFQSLSSHKETDDRYWDLWIILWSSDFCCGEYRNEDEAKRELERLQSVTDTKFRIEHIENAGYGDMRLVGGWRYFSNEDW